MSEELERLLHAGMERVTAEVRVSPGLARKAYRHNQKRRITARAVAATGTAAAVAGAAVAVAGGTGTPGKSAAPQVQTAAYVISHAQAALAAVVQGSTIEHVSTLFGPNSSGISDQAPPGRLSADANATKRESYWTYDGRARDAGFTATGQPTVAIGYSPGPGSGVRTLISVSYPTKTWWREVVRFPPKGALSAPPPPTCSEADLSFASASIRQALACGMFALAGHERIDGVDTIKIVEVRPPFPGVWETLWVDPSTYLPVRVTSGTIMGATTQSPRSGERVLGQQFDFQWLQPTPANLASLNVPIPAGFTQVAPPSPARP